MSKHKFNSDNFVFRPTIIAHAFREAGLVNQPVLVRESKLMGLLRQRDDKDNTKPSKIVHLVPAVAAA